MNRFSMRETEYPAVRRVMGPDRERLDDDMLERVLADQFPGAHAEDVEGFMSTLQSIGRKLAPLAQRALPGVIQGAMQGSVAGPFGAIAGALGGGAKTLLSGGARPAPAVAVPVAPSTPGPALQPPGVSGITPGPAPIQVGTAVPPSAVTPPVAATPAPAAVAQLVALLSRPETWQAVLALLMPGTGRDTVPVGGAEVPAVAFANAIAETAALVAEAAGHPLEQSYSEYLFDSVGQPRGDLVNPSERAALLLSDLAVVSAREALDEQDEADEQDESDEGAEPEAFDEADEADPLEAYEDALQGIARGY